ncbi:hypothetical protein ACJX0J_007830 [Zea mays]
MTCGHVINGIQPEVQNPIGAHRFAHAPREEPSAPIYLASTTRLDNCYMHADNLLIFLVEEIFREAEENMSKYLVFFPSKMEVKILRYTLFMNSCNLACLFGFNLVWMNDAQQIRYLAIMALSRISEKLNKFDQFAHDHGI